MAVGFDAAFESHTGTTGSTSEASFSWNHTPVGTPKGVLVFVITNANADYVTSITYDGVNVPAVPGAEAADTATEPGRCKAFFLGSGVPTTSPAVVQVNRTNNATEMYAVSITVTAATDTCVHLPDIVLTQENGGLGERAVGDGLPGTDSMRFAGGFFGHSTIPSVGANSTAVHDMDIGTTRAYRVVRETTAGQGFRFVGFSSGTSDDRAVVHLAVKEIFTSSLSGATGTLSGTILAGRIYTQAVAGTMGVLSGVLTSVRIFPVALAGAISTISGALSRQTLKSLSGMMGSLSGALTRSARKVLSGSTGSLLGSLTKQANKILSGTMGTLSGVLESVLIFQVALTGAISTISGALSRQTLKSLSGSTGAATGALSRLTLKSLSGTMGTLSAALSTMVVKAVNLAGAISTITGELTKRTGKPLAGSVGTVSGSLVKLTSKALAGTMGALSGALTQGLFKVVALSGSISTISGSLTKLTLKPLAGPISPIGELTKKMFISLSGSTGAIGGSIGITAIVRRAKMKAGYVVKVTTDAGNAMFTTTRTRAGSVIKTAMRAGRIRRNP